jgi:hypothetical protein
MAQTRFSGPVASDNGFVGAVTGNVTGAVAATTITASSTLAVTGNATLSGTANVIIIPTTDPGVAGAIWSDEGVLSISAGT